MKTFFSVPVFFLAALMGATSSAFAQGATSRMDVDPSFQAKDSQMTANADESATMEAVDENVSPWTLTATSFFYGPSLDDPTAGEVPTTWVGQSTGVTIQNQIGLQYSLTENLSLTPVFDFEVVMTDPNFEYKRDQYLALSYDSYIKAAYTNLVNFDLGPHGGWVNADIRVYVPTSDFSRNNNTLGSVRFTVAPGVQLAQSNWSVSLVNFVRYWAQSQDYFTGTNNVTLPRVMFYTGPLVNYQVNDNFGIWGLAEASVTYDTKGTPNTTQSNRSLVDLEPGFDVRLGKSFTISPYLNWFVNQPLSTTSVNVTANLAI